MSRIIEGMKEALEVAKCDHVFEFVRDHPHGNGVIGRCIAKCKCRFSSWPGTVHYEEIVAARERQQAERGG